MVTLRGAVGVRALERLLSLSWSASRSWACKQGRARPAKVRDRRIFFMQCIIKCLCGFARGILWLGYVYAFSVPCMGQVPAVTYSKELESRALAGDAEAQFQLGNCYFFGLGVAKKQIDGVAWYRKAAEAGHAEAQFNLGGCLYQGYGIEPNLFEALRWWRKSAGQNFSAAQISVGDCFLYGRGTEKNEAEAVRWYQKAAEQEYPAALHRLGNCYLQGTGVDRNIVEAMRYYRKAADLKYQPSIEVLHKLEDGSGA
ncbi:sel1 repeat family protein [bacterium]|nr:sel1 repeat family protein [bacterium]